MKTAAVNYKFNTAFKGGDVQAAQQQGSFSKKNKGQQSVQKPVYDKNPIKKSGERANAILATAAAGIFFGVRALAAIMDDGEGAQFVGEMAGKISKKILNRKGVQGTKTTLVQKIGAPIAVLAGFVGIMAILYTLYNSPKAMYDAKVNTFKKGKEMDVYIKGNAVEQELYNLMNDKAKSADEQEKARLNEQYAKLRAAKNVVPDFVKLKQPELIEAQKQPQNTILADINRT